MLIVLVASVACSAADPKAPQLTANAFKTRPRSVAIFKDGYGFFIREGKTRLLDGWCMTDYIPKAVAGTFWLYTLEPGTAVDTVRATSRNQLSFDDARELAELLTRYTGLSVSLKTEDAVTEGELLRVMDDMALVKSGKQVSVVRLADVRSAQVLDYPLMLRVGGAKPADDVTVMMGYLLQGINWKPTYILDLVSPAEARMSLRATITNQVEDLKDCAIYLVVGVPNFMMKGQLDPLTVHALGTSVLHAAPPGMAGPAQAYDNAAVAEVVRAPRGGYGETEASMLNVPIEGVQDMYFYEKKGLEMTAGDVVMTSVMDGTLPYRSLYTWDVDAGKEVQHHIVLTNTLASPLTTGPVMVLQAGKPISQDQLRYTPQKAETRLKLTQATDIRTQASEKEVSRQAEVKVDGLTYIPVVSEGQLVVENHRPDAADVEISWTLSGKVLEASDNAEIQSQAKVDEGLNPKSSLKCTVKVEPNQKHVTTYKYVRYVRARAS